MPLNFSVSAPIVAERLNASLFRLIAGVCKGCGWKVGVAGVKFVVSEPLNLVLRVSNVLARLKAD